MYFLQIKEITMDNAKLLLQIDNTNLTNNDFKNKYSSKVPGTVVVFHELQLTRFPNPCSGLRTKQRLGRSWRRM